jgi:nucleotide-binding universal stress UspA family protein
MVEIKNILCAVDFSEASSKVASYAQTLAKALNANVHVVYVAPSREQYPYFGMPPAGFQTFLDEVAADAAKIMETFIKDNFSITNVSGKVLAGDTVEAILGYAKDENIDLIVMGTHGRTGIGKVIFGSVAEKIVKASRIPVVTIRPD